jgi:branched-chain amino acid transport system substrate-binding protein
MAVAGLAVTACSSSKKSGTSSTTSGGSSSSSSAGALKLGFFGALTGPNAQLGINIENGEKLAISQYNASHAAHSVTIDSFDSQGQPSNANNGATKLISDHVVAVIGPAFSGESKAADPIFEQAGVVNVSASATNVALAQNGWKYFHRVLADDSYQGPGDADYLVKTLGDKSVAVIDDNSTYGAGLATAFVGQVTKDGGTVAVTDHLDPKGADYGSTVNKITASKATAVFFGGYYDAAGRLMHQLKTAGFTGAFMSGDGSEDSRFIQDAGGPSVANGAYLSCACADESTNPTAAAFVSAYKAMFNTAPAIYSAEAYDATNFVLAAIKSGATTSSAINSYLAANSYQGLTKTIKFQPNGNISGGTIYVYKVENGQIVQSATTS